MIIVADTAPLNYLILIKSAAILPKLFGLPEAFAQENDFRSCSMRIASS